MSVLGGIHHVSLNVDDAEAGRAFYEDVLGLARLQALGVEVSEPSVIGSGRQCFLHDPAGNLIELNQPDATGAPA